MAKVRQQKRWKRRMIYYKDSDLKGNVTKIIN